MTDQEKKMKRYVNAVERRLNLPREVRGRVMSDFATTIAALQEEGLTDGEIYARLGGPREVAQGLNEQMKEFAYRKSPWRFAGLAVAIVSGLLLAWCAGVRMLASLLTDRTSQSVGIIGGADGPTAIFVTTRAGIDWELVAILAALAAGLWVYRRLCRCKG